jgi:hypothetical protein
VNGVSVGGEAAAPGATGTAGAQERSGEAGEAVAEPVPDGRADDPALSPLRRIAAFPQPVRFLAIAVTATLWDARVAFVTLVVGCVVAATAQLADPAGDRR